MLIEISEHACERLAERFGSHPSKYMKLAQKAWASKLVVLPKNIPNKRFYELEKYSSRFIRYRELMGRIFVFDVKTQNKIVLVTIYPPSSTLSKKRGRILPH